MADPGEHDADISDQVWDELYERAREVKQQAWVPYSGFPVGAALLCDSGEIVTGCNVENASIGATICAERTALGDAISRGERSFEALCIVTDAEPPAAPCGICRQALAEFCEELPIVLANEGGEREEVTLAEIFPRAFRGDAVDASGG